MSFFLPKKFKQQRVDPDQAHVSCDRARAAGTNVKKPPKINKKKLVKLTIHTHACKDLTNFQYVVLAMTGNGSYLRLLKLAWKNS